MGLLRREEMYEKFSFLVFIDFGIGAKFGAKNEVYILSESGRKWC